jgi:ATP-dependent Clp protease adaptor protein ClpS
LYIGWPYHLLGNVLFDKIPHMATMTPEVSVPIRSVAPVPVPGAGDAPVLEQVPQKIRPPQLYQVVMLNDDYTPMEFVVTVLQKYFGKNREVATQIMLRIHLDGRGVCGVYTHDVANTKVAQVLEAARQANHPLQCVCEPVA